MPIVVGCAVWGHAWKGKTVRCLCDNAAVVAILRSGSAKDPVTMHLMRCLFFFTAASPHAPAGEGQRCGRSFVTKCLPNLPAVGVEGRTDHATRAPDASPSRPKAELDITSLEERCSFYFANGLASSS